MAEQPTKVFKILHFDDEPETVETIAEALFDTFAAHRSGWVGKTLPDWKGISDEKQKIIGQHLDFLISPSSSLFQLSVSYRIIIDPKAFEAELNHLPDGSIVFLDLCLDTPDGIKPVGFDFVQFALGKVGMGRFFILSGYPSAYMIISSGAWPPLLQGSLLTKPIAPLDVVRRITDLFPSNFCPFREDCLNDRSSY